MRIFILLCLSSFCTTLFAQVSSDYAVEIYASYSESPANITLHWNLYPTATDYIIYKKAKDATSWGMSVATLTGDAVAYSDDAVILDSVYEYKVTRNTSDAITAYGYIAAGVKTHMADHRGKCLLVVDTTITATLENEIYRLMKDISGDGWSVKRINVARNQTVISVQNKIIAEAEADPDVQSILLLGRVPVPYSGDLNPDGHPDHEGAWPADGIYGDIDVAYTDATVDVTVASRPENWNVPGDGKYDQSVFKSKLELQTGRIDFSNMPSFTEGEVLLLKQYLDKDHAFRSGAYSVAERGLVDDNFGAFAGEAFASNGWRNFAPMFGAGQTVEADYLTTMTDSAYLWSYGCGGGWYQGAGGVGSTADFVADSIQTIFTMLFGSYFGDWDATDDFLRAPLASGMTLTNCWAGRPYWQFHHMVLGENIGYSTRLSQNNTSTYMSNIFPHWVHIALMGDPTLRMHTVQPVENVTCSLAVEIPTAVGVDYSLSPDPNVIGYHIYRAAEEFGNYIRLTDDITNYSPWTDPSPLEGTNYYMVRAVTLKETPSGSYYNMSTGITDSIAVHLVAVNDATDHSFTIYPNPANKILTIELPDALINENFTVKDITGKILLSGSIHTSAQQLDVSRWPAGLYVISVRNAKAEFVVF